MPSGKPSPFIPSPSSLIPLYYWYGARPRILDLSPEQSGWLTCLLFTREGDCCLLPLAWHEELPGLLQSAPCPRPRNGDALSPETLRHIQHILFGDGWQLNGRLRLQFTGREAVADFEEQINALLNTHARKENKWS